MRLGGARPPPLITFTLTSKVAVAVAPAEWADTLTLFHLYENMYSVDHPYRNLRLFPLLNRCPQGLEFGCPIVYEKHQPIFCILLKTDSILKRKISFLK